MRKDSITQLKNVKYKYLIYELYIYIENIIYLCKRKQKQYET